MPIPPLTPDVLGENYNICICEGAAEEAIINLLLDNDKLLFTRDSLIEKKTERIRSAKKITSKYLNRDYTKGINILRILDSRSEQFKLGKLYKERFPVYNFHTTPEIEMLIIIDKGDYHKFSNAGGREKPSEYCKKTYGMKNVKSAKFVRDYFSDIDVLTNSIKEYNRVSEGHGLYSLYHLLKPEV